MSILEAKVAMMEFASLVRFNKNRKSYKDKYFVGVNPDYYNDVMRHLNLNATLIKARRFGTCYSNGSCSGIFSLIQSGKADFSLPALPFTISPNVSISSRHPIYHGPLVTDDPLRITGLPITDSKYIDLDVLQIYKATPSIVYSMMIMIFFVVYFINKIPFYGRRRRKVTFFSLFSTLINNKLISRPKLLSSSVAIAMYSFLVLFILKIMSGSINSDMMKVYPDQYYETLEQLVDDLELNKVQVRCVKYHRADSFISGRDDLILYKKLYSSMKYVSRMAVFKLPKIMLKHHPTTFIDFRLMSSLIKSLFCGHDKKLYIRLHHSKPFFVYQTAIAMNSNISFALRQRVINIFNRVTEGRILYQHYKKVVIASSSLAKISPTSLVNCRSAYLYEKYYKKQVKPPKTIDFNSVAILFVYLLLFWSISLFIYLVERLTSKCCRKKVLSSRVHVRRRKRKCSCSLN